MADAESNQNLVPIESIAHEILVLRGLTVIIDSDLARLYGVSTKQLNQAVKRNQTRFPSDFVLQLTESEKTEVVTFCDHLQKLKYSSTLPYAFTEHGALMVASVLNTPRAVQLSVYVVRAFVQLREMLNNNIEMSRRLAELEARTDKHDAKIGQIIEAIRQLMLPPETPQRRIGFRSGEQEP